MARKELDKDLNRQGVYCKDNNDKIIPFSFPKYFYHSYDDDMKATNIYLRISKHHKIFFHWRLWLKPWNLSSYIKVCWCPSKSII